MAYAADRTPQELTALTSLASDDTIIVGDTSDVSEVVKSITKANLVDDILNGYQLQPAEGAFVDGDKTKLDGIEALADVTDTTNVTAAGALMDSEVTNLAQVKAFDSSDYATASQGALADTALQNVVEDTTPQLGGNLDAQNNQINNVSSVLFDNGTRQGYLIDTHNTNAIHWEAQDPGSAFRMDYCTADKDGTDAVKLRLFGFGDDGDANTERQAIGWDAANSWYELKTNATGTGTLRDLHIYTGSDTNQLVVGADGTVKVQGTDVQVQPSEGAFADGDKTKLDGIETGADVTDTTNVTSAGAVMDSELADITAIKTLQAPDNTTISTFGATLVDDADAATARTTLGAYGAGDDPTFDLITYDAARGKVTAGGNLGATETINFNDETNYTGNLDSDITFTFANATSGDEVTLYLTYSGAQRTITWPSITWLDNNNGSAPTTPSGAGEVLVVTVRYIGTTYYASATGNYAVYS